MNKVLQWLTRLAHSIILIGILAGAGSALAAPPTTTINSTGPLSRIFLGNELGMQVERSGDTDWEVFEPQTAPGDFGTFAVIGGTLYAPDFASYAHSATWSLGAHTPFTPVSQSAVTGSGTAADPYKVVTVVDADATGIRITQTVTYVTGNDFFLTDTVLTNSGATAQDVLLYRAMDCYMGNDDNGYGYVNAASNIVACTKNANNTPAGRVEAMTSLTAGGHYMETFYDTLWAKIGAHQPFPDTCQCANNIDNALGYSWSITVPANGSTTVSDKMQFSLVASGFGGGNLSASPVPATDPEVLAVLALLMTLMAVWALRAQRRKF